MALYLVVTEAGTAIVRARNGYRAQELVGAGAVMRLTEDGPEEIIAGRMAAPERERRPPQRFLGDAAD